ncbi:cysteine dioxygenase [Streptantibioticus parmotrematis]|uniref:cysteine dioxygenase n=1 Tax=Streptantibioticus parmotrematis TaxID=2873249 RepID=UPI0027E19E3B|nr:cysteine dioxygenase family protein [Streptantibioticus parmotrematis]
MYRAPLAAVPAVDVPRLSDISIAGDPLALPHLLPPVPRHPATVAEFAGLARSVAADRERWAPLVRYDATTRWYARLATGPGYEVWLLSWVPGQGTGPHDHGDSSGVLTVLAGELTERSITPGGERRDTLRPGAVRVAAPGHVHEVVNDSLEPAVSLHVYFPGLTEMTPYGHVERGALAEAAGGAAAGGGQERVAG